MLAIYKRELRSFFHGMMGYVLTAFLLAASGIYFLALNLGYGLTDFGYYTLYRTIFVLLLYFPVLAMRSLAEERRARTDQLLLTSGVRVGHRGGQVSGPLHRVRAALSGRRHHDRRALAAGRHGSASGQISPRCCAISCWAVRPLPSASSAPASRRTRSSRQSWAFGSAAGLYDAQPPQYVQRRERRGTGSLYGSVGGSLPCGGPAHPELHAGLLLLCGPLCRAERLFLLRSAWLTEAFSAVLSALCLFAPFEEFVNNSFSIQTLVYYLTVPVLFLFFTAQGIEKRRWN